MRLCVLLVAVLVASLSFAGEEPGAEKPIYIFIMMNDKQGKITHYRLDIPPGEDCYAQLDLVRLGPHSRATAVCGTSLESDRTIAIKFSKRAGGDGAH